VGLQGGVDGLGTGLANLRERLRLAFGEDATFSLQANAAQGVRASVGWPHGGER
jgi:LytS/YehU family sensor histidine kinase